MLSVEFDSIVFSDAVIAVGGGASEAIWVRSSALPIYSSSYRAFCDDNDPKLYHDTQIRSEVALYSTAISPKSYLRNSYQRKSQLFAAKTKLVELKTSPTAQLHL